MRGRSEACVKRLCGAACSIFSPGRRSLLLVRLIAGLFLVITAGALREARAVGPATSVSPASTRVGVGSDVTLDIDAAGIGSPGIGGYVVTLSWDPSIASLTSLTDAGWVTGGLLIVFCSTATIDNTLGIASLDCTPLPLFGEPGVTTTAPHVMAQAVFHGESSGFTAITLDGPNTTLLDNVGDPLASTISNGSLRVMAGAGGVALPPDVAALAATDGGQRHDDLRFGLWVLVLVGAALAGGVAIVARRQRRADR